MIEKIAVLGAGTMGSRIAGLFAEAGLSVLLLDVTEEQARQSAVPVTTAAFDAGIPLLGGYDWVLEAVVEDLETKRALWAKAAAFLSPHAIASTNTSGLSIASLVEGLPPSFAAKFLGVHFFNPPAKLPLVEVVPTDRTDATLLQNVSEFLTERLARKVVQARDTPNFIANRIGAYFSYAAQAFAVEGGWTVEEVDYMTGPLIGMPRTGTFRLMDIIGLDVWARVLQTSDLPLESYLPEMLRRNWLGAKTGGGFYKKNPDQALDLLTLKYRPLLPPRPQCNAASVRPLIADLVRYSHEVAPLIAHHPSDLDQAMRWGYGWARGPFEMECESFS